NERQRTTTSDSERQRASTSVVRSGTDAATRPLLAPSSCLRASTSVVRSGTDAPYVNAVRPLEGHVLYRNTAAPSFELRATASDNKRQHCRLLTFAANRVVHFMVTETIRCANVPTPVSRIGLGTWAI